MGVLIHQYHTGYKKRLQLKALAFAALLCSVLVISICLSFMSSGPIILGTEMNTDGSVEYLCLGNGCENSTPMGW